MTPILTALAFLSILVSPLLPALRPPQQAATTPEAAAISVREVDLFLMPHDGKLRVGLSFVIANSGTEAYTGEAVAGADRPVTVVYPIPQDAQDLRFDATGDRFTVVPGGLADTSPVAPGDSGLETQISYDLPTIVGSAVTFSMAIPVQSVVVLIASEEYQVATGELSELGWMDTDLGRTRVYSAGPLAPDQPITFSLGPATAAPAGSGTAASAPPVASSADVPNPTAELIVGVIALAAALPAAYLLWRPRRRTAMPAAAAPVVQALATLQDDLEDGRVTAGDYRKRQASLRRELAAFLGKPVRSRS